MNDQIKCPKCSSTQLTANKKGFNGKKAFAGAVLTGGVGLLAGTIGSNKILITCLSCGNQFKPGENRKTTVTTPKIIWDETQKKHVINPAHSNDTMTMSFGSFMAVVGVIVLIILVILMLK
jgi:DNA-directed RNA polymerase subunit RPC12/RpoP